MLPRFTERHVAAASLADADPAGVPANLVVRIPPRGPNGELGLYDLARPYVCNGVPMFAAVTGAANPWRPGELVVVPEGDGWRLRPARVTDARALQVIGLVPDDQPPRAPTRPLPALAV